MQSGLADFPAQADIQPFDFAIGSSLRWERKSE